jgi:hypothetical protein
VWQRHIGTDRIEDRFGTEPLGAAISRFGQKGHGGLLAKKSFSIVNWPIFACSRSIWRTPDTLILGDAGQPSYMKNY